MPLFAATIALSALLLFLVQPIVAKQILPWFGGSAGVWSVCLVFFQTALLAGYAYAHLLTRSLRPVRQFQVHAVLLVASLALLPIIPAAAFKPRGGEDAAMAILVLLIVTIGLPYFLLSSTGPLLQAWIARRFPGRSVYRLFALSNLGSLLGLVAFPFLVEPLLDSRRQAITWSVSYLLFVVACAFAANLSRKSSEAPRESGAAHGAQVAGGTDSDAAVAESAAGGASNAASRWSGPGSAMVWLGLAGLGVVLLLSTTNQLQQNVASIPFLWVLPLALYLLSFVVVFEARKGRGWYNPKWGVPLALIAALLMAGGLSANNGVLDVSLAVPLYCTCLFIACVFCHGELAARKPATADLTRYYLMISVGGALGGIFVGLVAPRIFPSLYELPLGLLFVAVAGFLAALRRPGLSRVWIAGLCTLSVAAAGAIAWADWTYVRFLDRDLVLMERNFYGTLRVREVDEDGVRVRRLLHGVILHGEQPMSGPEQNKPGSYYTSTSGVGMALLRAQERKPSARVGVIGLGVGTLASYGRANDSVRFYELDRDVVTIANASFTYLRSSPARIEVALGDARLSLEDEWEQGKPQQFDVLAVDAFSSDSIPVHLITREAIELYVHHLAPDGILAVHISNRFLDLQPVLANIAGATGFRAVLINDDVDESRSNASSSEWVLIASDPRTLDGGPIGEHGEALRQQADVGVWTDGYNNLLRVVKNTPWEAIQRLVTSWREDS
jgi:hypothetical protein